MRIQLNPILARKALRDLWADRWRGLSIAVTLAAGIGMAAGTDMAVRTLLATRDAIFAECNAADLELRLTPRELEFLPDLTALPEVKAAERRLIFPGTIDLPAGTRLSAQAVFLENPDPHVNRLKILAGKALTPGDTAGVVIEQALSRYHGVWVGDTLRLRVGRALYVCPVRGIALSGEFVSASTNPQSFIPQKGTLAVIFGNLDRITQRLGFGMANSLVVQFAPETDAGAARAAVVTALAGTTIEEVVPRERQFSYRFLQIDLHALEIYVPAIEITLGGLSLLIAILGFRRMVWARRKEIGTLRALGYRRREVLAGFGGMGLALGLLGAGLGLPSALFIRDAFAGIYGNAIGMPRIDHHFFPRSFGIAAGQAVLISTGTMVLSVSRLLRQPPHRILRRLEQRERIGGRIPHLFVRWTEPLHVTVRWALRNLVRRPGLTATTVVAVGIAVGVAAAYRISLHSMHEAARVTCEHEHWDLQVDFHYPVYPEELDELAALDGIRAMDPYLARPVDVVAPGGVEPAVLLGVDPASDMRSVTIQYGRYLEPGECHGVVISPDIARRLGAVPGDSVGLEVADGERVRVAVVGVTRDIVLGRVLAPLAAARQWSRHEEQASGVFLRGDFNDKRLNVLHAVDFVARTHPKSELMNDVLALLDQEMAIVEITATISLAIALLLLLTSLNLAVTERVGEYATLRSLGCDPPMLARMVRIEGLVQAAIAAVLAIPAAWLIADFLNGRLERAWFPVGVFMGPGQIVPPILVTLALTPFVVLPAVRGILAVDLATALRQRVIE
jgi:putative ABC transport system permease protein